MAPSNPRRRNRLSHLTGPVAMAAVAGLLIWSKLRLVSDIPRSAYADPKPTTENQIETESEHQAVDADDRPADLAVEPVEAD